jgi:hypothetical protein
VNLAEFLNKTGAQFTVLEQQRSRLKASKTCRALNIPSISTASSRNLSGGGGYYRRRH